MACWRELGLMLLGLSRVVGANSLIGMDRSSSEGVDKGVGALGRVDSILLASVWKERAWMAQEELGLMVTVQNIPARCGNWLVSQVSLSYSFSSYHVVSSCHCVVCMFFPFVIVIYFLGCAHSCT